MGGSLTTGRSVRMSVCFCVNRRQLHHWLRVNKGHRCIWIQLQNPSPTAPCPAVGTDGKPLLEMGGVWEGYVTHSWGRCQQQVLGTWPRPRVQRGWGKAGAPCPSTTCCVSPPPPPAAPSSPAMLTTHCEHKDPAIQAASATPRPLRFPQPPNHCPEHSPPTHPTPLLLTVPSVTTATERMSCAQHCSES